MFPTKRTFILVLIDFLSAMFAWSVFFYFRKVSLEKVEFVADTMFYIGICCIPVGWIFLYTLQGTYVDVKRIYRIQIFNFTFLASLIGATCLFFAVLLDDEIGGYKYYYESFLTLFILHFSITFLPRFLFVSIQVYRIQNRKDNFKTLLLGGSEKAVGIYKEIQSAQKSAGNHFVGFVNLNGIDTLLKDELPYLGHVDDLESILENLEVEEVVIALESTEHKRLNTIIARFTGSGIRIKVLPDMYDILAGSVKMNNIFGVLLLELSPHKMPVWQKSMKRMLDISLSIIAIICLIPLYIGLAIAVKTTSSGPVFFFQERIGRNGKRFNIVKFRTMYINAEEQGPQLSSSDDPRITRAGRFMRKLRLDEFPQFFNVLKGEMSLVGPRPERQFYIDQIVKIEPQFLHLTNVRPGITSWGQVKFGYAENVDQMIQRMKFDLLYLKNMSLALDLKILLYTVLVILKAKGK